MVKNSSTSWMHNYVSLIFSPLVCPCDNNFQSHVESRDEKKSSEVEIAVIGIMLCESSEE